MHVFISTLFQHLLLKRITQGYPKKCTVKMQKNVLLSFFRLTLLLKLCCSSVISVRLLHLANLLQSQCCIWILPPIRRNQGQEAASQVAARETAAANRKPPAAVPDRTTQQIQTVASRVLLPPNSRCFLWALSPDGYV